MYETRPKEYKLRIVTSISFEASILDDFQELCNAENISMSKKINELILAELESKKDVQVVARKKDILQQTL